MEENDLEETRHGNGAGIWPQYRHISDQRLQTFRFALGLLGASSVVLTAIILYGAGPWVCTAWGVLVAALCTPLAAMDRRFAARLRSLENFLQSPNGSRAKKGESGKGATAGLTWANLGRGQRTFSGMWCGHFAEPTWPSRFWDYSAGHCHFGTIPSSRSRWLRHPESGRISTEVSAPTALVCR
jgi:hypothetical protein